MKYLLPSQTLAPTTHSKLKFMIIGHNQGKYFGLNQIFFNIQRRITQSEQGRWGELLRKRWGRPISTLNLVRKCFYPNIFLIIYIHIIQTLSCPPPGRPFSFDPSRVQCPFSTLASCPRHFGAPQRPGACTSYQMNYPAPRISIPFWLYTHAVL